MPVSAPVCRTGRASPAFFRALRVRPLVPAAGCLMLGVAAGAALPAPPALCLLLFLALVLCLLILLALKVNCTLPILAAFAFAGYSLLASSLPGWAGDPWAPAGAVRVAGTVVEAGVTGGGYVNYVLDDVRIGGSETPGRVSLTVRTGTLQGGAGDTLTAFSTLKRPAPGRFFGDFNARGWALRRGVRFTGFASACDVERAVNPGAVAALVERARRYSDGVLATHLRPEGAALVDALLTGDDAGIAEDTREAFRSLGATHLLAVSGLNISLTAGAAWLLLRRLRVPGPLSLAASLAVLLGYVLFAGPTPSVVRAAAMWLAGMGALVAARRYDPPCSLAAAAVAILAVNPADLFDAGFQLSFAATAAIILWAAPLMRRVPNRPGLRFLAGSLITTVCVTAMALPVTLHSFHGLPPMAPAANLVLVPFSLVLQLGGSALLLAGPVPAFAALLGGAVNLLADRYLDVVSFLNGAGGPVAAASPAPWLAAAYAVPALLLSPALVRLPPRGRLAALAVLAACAAVMLSPLSPALTARGAAAVLSEGASVSLFWRDGNRRFAACGGRPDTLRDYLASRGITSLDGLYVLQSTPPDGGALLEGIGGIAVGRLYVPGAWLADQEAQPFLQCARDSGMEPADAGTGPCALFLTETGGSAVLTVAAGGYTVAFAPYASVRDFAEAAGPFAAADVSVLNVGGARSARLLEGLAPARAVLPAEVAPKPYSTYNIRRCGSIEIVPGDGKPVLVPWADGRTDGIQGNFR